MINEVAFAFVLVFALKGKKKGKSTGTPCCGKQLTSKALQGRVFSDATQLKMRVGA